MQNIQTQREMNLSFSLHVFFSLILLKFAIQSIPLLTHSNISEQLLNINQVFLL